MQTAFYEAGKNYFNAAVSLYLEYGEKANLPDLPLAYTIRLKHDWVFKPMLFLAFHSLEVMLKGYLLEKNLATKNKIEDYSHNLNLLWNDSKLIFPEFNGVVFDNFRDYGFRYFGKDDNFELKYPEADTVKCFLQPGDILEIIRRIFSQCGCMMLDFKRLEIWEDERIENTKKFYSIFYHH